MDIVSIEALGGTALGLLILQEVRRLTTYITTGDRERKRQEAFDLMASQTQQLFDLHNQRDDDGVPVWYVRRSLENAIEKLADNIGTQTTLLGSLVERVGQMGTLLDKLRG